MQRQHLRFARLIKFRCDNHGVKPAGSGKTTVQFRQVSRLVVIPFFERHEVLQVLFTNLRTFKRHIAKAVAFSAVVVDIPEGLTPIQRNPQLAFIELAVKVALTQGNVRQLFFEMVVVTVVKHGTDFRPRAEQVQVIPVGTRPAAQDDVRAANQYRLTRRNAGNKNLAPLLWRRAEIEINGGFVIPQRFQPFTDGVIDARAKTPVRRHLITLDGRQLRTHVFFQRPG